MNLREKRKVVLAYTDGSAIVKGDRLGGFGVYMKFNGKEHFLSKGYSNTTVSRMEMRAVIYTLRKIPKTFKGELVVYSDSAMVVNSINKGWLLRWEREKFKDRVNSDLWKNMLKEIRFRKLLNFSIFHTRGHRTDLDNHIAFGNHVADMLADYKNFDEFEEDICGKKNYYLHKPSGDVFYSYSNPNKLLRNRDIDMIDDERLRRICAGCGWVISDIREIKI